MGNNSKNNSIEHFNSSKKVEARSNMKELEIKENNNQFEKLGYSQEISTILKPLEIKGLITNKEINKIIEKVKVNYKGEKKGFNLMNELKNVIIGIDGNNFVFSNVEIKGTAKEYKQKTIDYSKKVWNLILKNSNKQENTNEGTEKNKKVEKIDKNLFNTPLNPLIEGLKENGYIAEDIKITGNIKEDKNTIKNNIKGNKELESNITDYLEQKTTVTENTFEKSNFYQEAQDFSFLNPEVNGLDLLLAENYISIPNKESGEKDREKDLNRTMDIALNKILKVNSKEFSEVYSDEIDNVRKSTNLQDKYDALQEIYKLDLKSDAKFFAKNAKLRKLKIEKKLENIENKIKKENNTQNKEKLIKEKKELEIQLKDTQKSNKEELKQGDVKTGGGEKDVITNNLEKGGETA